MNFVSRITRDNRTIEQLLPLPRRRRGVGLRTRFCYSNGSFGEWLVKCAAHMVRCRYLLSLTTHCCHAKGGVIWFTCTLVRREKLSPKTEYRTFLPEVPKCLWIRFPTTRVHRKGIHLWFRKRPCRRNQCIIFANLAAYLSREGHKYRLSFGFARRAACE